MTTANELIPSGTKISLASPVEVGSVVASFFDAACLGACSVVVVLVLAPSAASNTEHCDSHKTSSDI